MAAAATDLPKAGTEIDVVQGTAHPMPGDDVDTDRIIPARFLKCITFEGLGEHAFHDERHDDDGNPADHPINDERFEGASIMLVGRNFGCGSSREHAPQALMRFGMRAFVGESFGDIFAGNCTSLGMPAVTLLREQVQALMDHIDNNPAEPVTVDLRTMTVTAGPVSFTCSMPEAQRKALMNGAWDSTAVLMEAREAIDETLSRLPYVNGFA